ncbi:transcription-repair coupling factor [Facklamia miroungae]|uniref:Transcription-repair-coupling factor n=1 Tax=Facklamia miroungae TaxID=120956 RepID=A0A1G7RPV9_9LACT|nr:transcription-repair coupling factor [Facklamia miroungae]NKZ29327.1 transcription-repair coupling factor [Facklamia miroungae]SDG12683.1 transcription-repair coupling factor (superfamily II helicase) [Facklamia miroungae]
MLDKLQTTAFSQSIQTINKANNSSLPHLVTGLDGSGKAIYIAKLYQKAPSQMLIIESNPNHLMQMLEDLSSLLPNVAIYSFPAEESLALEYSTASLEGRAQRVECLQALLSKEPAIILTNVAGIRKRLSPINDWLANQLELAIGDEIERDVLENVLFELGYQRVSMVMAPGEYSVRGSIIDFYPLNYPSPIRLDFFDVELDSIRYFDAESQISKENLQSIKLEPAVDVLFTQRQQNNIKDQLIEEITVASKKIKDSELKQKIKQFMGEQIQGLDHDQSLDKHQAFLCFHDSVGHSILDYMHSTGRLIVNEFSKIQQEEVQLMEHDQFWIEQETLKGHLFPNQNLKLSAFNQIKESHHQVVFFDLIQKSMGKQTLASIHHFSYRTMNAFYHQMPLIKAEMDHWLKQGQKIQLIVESEKRAKKIRQLFAEYQIEPVHLQKDEKFIPDQINILVGNLNQGFELPNDKWVLLTEKELFNRIKKKVIKQQKLSNAERIKSYNELETGDYVVHINHGIGRYTGMETMEIAGSHRDLLVIEYQNNAKVMVPIDQLHLIQKYVSSGEAKTPKIHRLGGTEWTKTKQKVSSKIEDIADELIELYAKREQEKGFAFNEDSAEQQEFENAFPYVETPDQLQASSEIKKDMEKERPMDRLLIGDVGYGKTEVAMRAIFKAVMDGKQVAFLVPTTILAQQHYNSLMERFADYPFEIRMLSRFVSKANQKETIKDLKVGACQIVVGTHRILSKDIAFLDLGLLVVDEEQRFGVKHKERLKQLRSQVDVLTLTATPIPRTLHMSMIGVRDLSVIETPPSNRYPVQTYVMERDEGAIKSALEREMARGGQAFYLYNRVATIYHRAEELAQLVPEARVAVAHGQMSEIELENVLYDFVQGDYDLLVTTTIIETGVDIPNANTLFIDHADKMGLSTLYQLRGRVGRTNRLAYAYLMYDPMKQLSEVSEKRLNAIREFTELGSGFKIAMRDLSIRGAGNLLGAQQSGFIDSIGFDLYSQLLKEAVDKKQGKENHQKAFEQSETEIDLAIDAYLPATYIEDERQKIAAYKAIQQINSFESYRDVQDQLIDRYGEYPDQVADLLDIALLRHLADQIGVLTIKKQHQYVILTFDEKATQFFYGPNIYEALQDVKAREVITKPKDRMLVKLTIQGLKSYEILSVLKKLLDQANQVYFNYQNRQNELNQALN